MGVVNIDRIPASKRVGGCLNIYTGPGIITDTLVNANATLTLLKAAVTAGVIHPDDAPKAVKVNRALAEGLSLGVFTETHGCTTVAGLVQLTDAASTYRQDILG